MNASRPRCDGAAPATAGAGRSAIAGRLWLLAAGVMAGLELGRRVLVNNDEARFPLLARDILERGSWLLPNLNGVPYVNKPPLLAWLIALASRVEGRVTPVSAALPSALAAVATAAVVHALGREAVGPRAGRCAALAAIATAGFVLHARLAMPDMLLTCAATAAIWMLWRALEGRRRAWLGFWGFAAAAFWAKGPPGLLPLLVAVVVVLALGRPDRFAVLAPARGILLWLLAVTPWIALTVAAGPARAAHVAVDDQFRWYVSGPLHPGRLLDPVRNAAGILYPWVLVVPIAAVDALAVLRRREGPRAGLVFILAWGATVIGAVALSNQQRLRYYLPVLPPAALLVGWWLARPAPEARSEPRALGRPGTLLIATGAVLALGTALASRGRPAGAPASLAEGVVAAAVPVAVAAVLLAGRSEARRWTAFAVAWLVAAAVVLAGYHVEVGRLNAMSDYPSLPARLAPRLAGDVRLGALDVPELPAAFYLGRPVTVLRSPAEVPAFVTGPPPGIVLVGNRTLPAVPDQDRLALLGDVWLALRPATVIGPDGPPTP